MSAPRTVAIRPVKRSIRATSSRVVQLDSGVAVSAGVTSFNTRKGAVVPASGDYTAAQIDETAARVFVTPAQKTAIGTAIQPDDLGTPDVAGFAAGDPSKLAGIATGANKYTHPNHSGDVTSVGDGAQTIAARAVTAAKLFAVATARFLGRLTAGSGDVEELTAAQIAGALTHNDIGSRTAADSHPETAISSAFAEMAVSAGAATLTVSTGVAYYRRKLDCDGGVVALSIEGTITEVMAGEFVIRDGGSISWDAAWKWQTDSGTPPTPPAASRVKVYWEATEDKAGTGIEIWAWYKGVVDDA